MAVIGRVLLFSLLIRCINAEESPSRSTALSNYVVTVKEADSDVKVTLIPMIQHQDPEPFPTKFIPNQRLAPDCGDQFFRCQPLHTSPEFSTKITSSINSAQGSSSDTESILLVPLQNGLLLLEIRSSINNQDTQNQMEFGSSQILASTGCSPTTVFRIYDSLYTMCTDLQNRYISLYEVRLNITQLEQSQLIGPLTSLSSESLDIFTSSDVMNMSNFLLYTDIPHQPFIYFAIDNYLFTIDPLDWLFYDEFTPLGNRCRKINRLVKVSKFNYQLLAYCLGEYVYYDTELQYWLSEHTYESSGVPYFCPDQNYEVIVQEDYLEYEIGSKMGSLSNVDVDNGLCLNGTAGNNFFTYTDKTTDSVRFFNLTSASETCFVSFTTECSDVDCIPLLLVGGRYLVIQQAGEDGIMRVLDTQSDFKTVINEAHQTPSLVTIVQGTIILNSPSIVPHNNGEISGGHTAIVVVLCVIIPIAILMTVLILAGVVMLLRFKGVIQCRRITEDLQEPLEEVIVPIQPVEIAVSCNYPQHDQETENGRDKCRMLQPFSNNGYRDFLVEKPETVADKITDEQPGPQMAITSESAKISYTRENATNDDTFSPRKYNDDVNTDSIISNESDTQPLLN